MDIKDDGHGGIETNWEESSYFLSISLHAHLQYLIDTSYDFSWFSHGLNFSNLMWNIKINYHLVTRCLLNHKLFTDISDDISWVHLLYFTFVVLRFIISGFRHSIGYIDNQSGIGSSRNFYIFIYLSESHLEFFMFARNIFDACNPN